MNVLGECNSRIDYKPAQSFLLSHASVNGNCRKILFNEKLGESGTPLDTLDEDDDLYINLVLTFPFFFNC